MRLTRGVGLWLAVAGLVLLVRVGLDLWELAPPAYLGLALGKTLVALAAIIAVGLGLVTWARNR